MRRALVLLCLVATGSGCGGDGEATRSAPPSPETVVRAWAADMRRGDVDAATALFAVPAIVANGTPEIRLETRTQIRVFNDTLPCGGRVTKTKRHHGVVIATFELTDRPGGDCGSGAGNTAQAAFDVRDGKIVRWIRVPQGSDPAAPPAPVV